MEKIVKFIKIRDVKSPERGFETSSGIDFFVPTDLKEVKVTPKMTLDFKMREVEVNNSISVFPGEGLMIPSGIKTIIKPGYDLVLNNKSGVAVKQGLVIGACVIDSEYRGETHLHLINTSKEVQRIKLGQKIVQGIVRKVELSEIEEITEEEFNKNSETDRGEGGFGSTGS